MLRNDQFFRKIKKGKYGYLLPREAEIFPLDKMWIDLIGFNAIIQKVTNNFVFKYVTIL
jgi:hypothetical protein